MFATVIPVSENYDDIEKLLSHEMLGSFEYQSFKKSPVAAAAVQIVEADAASAPAAAPAVRTLALNLPESTRGEGRQLRLVASKSDVTAPRPQPPATPATPPSGAVDQLFQRLTRVAPERPAPTPVLDLRLPERPMLAAEAIRGRGLGELSPQEAFARLLGGRPVFMEALSA